MHYLAKRHTDVEGVALDVGSTRYGDPISAVIVERRLSGINSLDVGLDVLGIPIILIAATSIKADNETFEVHGQDESAVSSTAVGIELLFVEFVGDTIVPDIVNRIGVVVRLRCDREGVGCIVGISLAWFVVEACHIARDVYVARITVVAFWSRTVIAVGDVVDEYLHILVAVDFLLGFKTECRS